MSIMKNLTALIIIGLLILSFPAHSQNAKLDKDGNYVALSSSQAGKTSSKPTGKTFTDSKGVVYPVMESKNGKLFYIRKSKTGNEYKVYIKVN
jgi:hypothetical protein